MSLFRFNQNLHGYIWAYLASESKIWSYSTIWFQRYVNLCLRGVCAAFPTMEKQWYGCKLL